MSEQRFFIEHRCGLGFARPEDCVSSLCRERGCHDPLLIIEARRVDCPGCGRRMSAREAAEGLCAECTSGERR